MLKFGWTIVYCKYVVMATRTIQCFFTDETFNYFSRCYCFTFFGNKEFINSHSLTHTQIHNKITHDTQSKNGCLWCFRNWIYKLVMPQYCTAPLGVICMRWKPNILLCFITVPFQLKKWQHNYEALNTSKWICTQY